MLSTGARKTARRRWSCPSDTRVAAYLEQTLEPRERSRFEEHLADCDFCLGMVGALVRQQRASEPVEAPVRCLEKASSGAPTEASWAPFRRWVLVPALASIVVAIAVMLWVPHHGKFAGSTSARMIGKATPAGALQQRPSQPSDEQYVRKLRTPSIKEELLEPKSDSVVSREGLRFRWTPVGNADYYEVRVVDSEGDLLWQGQESTPKVQLPHHIAVPPGKYFVWVRVYLHNGSTIISEPVPFTVSK